MIAVLNLWDQSKDFTMRFTKRMIENSPCFVQIFKILKMKKTMKCSH